MSMRRKLTDSCRRIGLVATVLSAAALGGLLVAHAEDGAARAPVTVRATVSFVSSVATVDISITNNTGNDIAGLEIQGLMPESGGFVTASPPSFAFGGADVRWIQAAGLTAGATLAGYQYKVEGAAGTVTVNVRFWGPLAGNASSGPVVLAGMAAGNSFVSPNPTGLLQTVSTTGAIDQSGLFFTSLGTNGRSCGTCHVPSNGWTIAAADVQARFRATAGFDPLFRTNDGSNSPVADVSTLEARQAAYSMLLNRAVIRVDLPIPANAEFNLAGVDDPYGYASTHHLSLFRRPLPATNLGFLTAVMWDGRQTVQPIRSVSSNGPSTFALQQGLASQAADATASHAQASVALTQAQLDEIVAFELAHFTAQSKDNSAGDLGAAGALGGPAGLPTQLFFVGINDPLGLNPTGATFNPRSITLYDAWAGPGSTAAQQSVARGQLVFTTKQFDIKGVGGLNDIAGQTTIRGTCTVCHDTPNVGDHSVSQPLNIGIADASRRTPDQPLYTLQNKTTGEIVQTTDPGRALITGKWQDIGKVKGPVLRGLAARAPYFHNGSASTLQDVVDFYDDRFGIGFTPQEEADLIAFLLAL